MIACEVRASEKKQYENRVGMGEGGGEIEEDRAREGGGDRGR